jgi:hypothetical protein
MANKKDQNDRPPRRLTEGQFKKRGQQNLENAPTPPKNQSQAPPPKKSK